MVISSHFYIAAPHFFSPRPPPHQQTDGGGTHLSPLSALCSRITRIRPSIFCRLPPSLCLYSSRALSCPIVFDVRSRALRVSPPTGPRSSARCCRASHLQHGLEKRTPCFQLIVYWGWCIWGWPMTASQPLWTSHQRVTKWWTTRGDLISGNGRRPFKRGPSFLWKSTKLAETTLPFSIKR